MESIIQLIESAHNKPIRFNNTRLTDEIIYSNTTTPIKHDIFPYGSYMIYFYMNYVWFIDARHLESSAIFIRPALNSTIGVPIVTANIDNLSETFVDIMKTEFFISLS